MAKTYVTAKQIAFAKYHGYRYGGDGFFIYTGVKPDEYWENLRKYHALISKNVTLSSVK